MIVDVFMVGGRTWLIHHTPHAGMWVEPPCRVSDIDQED